MDILGKKESTDEQMEIKVFHCRAKAKLLNTSKFIYAQKSLSSILINVLQTLHAQSRFSP